MIGHTSSALKRILLTILLLIGLLTWSDAAKKEVLVLHSYNFGLQWTDDINRGIIDYFGSRVHTEINLRFEFMDTKRFEDAEYLALYASYLTRKYAQFPFDAVIVADNAAFNLVIDYHSTHFNSIPVIFCGLNFADSIPPGFTGIMEDVDYRSNLSLINKLHPGYRKVYFVVDRSITGLVVKKELDSVIHQHFPDLRHDYLTDYSFNELKQKIGTLDPEDIVVMLLFNFDRHFEPISYDIIMEELSPYLNSPVYGVWSFYLKEGIIGGRITDGHNHGMEVASVASRILAGKAPESIPVTDGTTHYVFDYKALKKNGINLSQLPEGSTVINSPYNFLKEHRNLIIQVGLIILMLIAFITIILRQLRIIQGNLNNEKVLSRTIELKSVEIAEALTKAKEANKLKIAFLSNISHEVRTPMNGILGFTELLKNESDPETYQLYINTIQKAGNQLLNIINDILDISLIESNQVKLHKVPFVPVGIIETLIFQFEHMNTKPNLKFKADIPENLKNFEIEGDGTKFHQIVANLLSNAQKFTESGIVRVGVKQLGERLVVFVTDTGIGIAEEHQQVIFERFRQVGGTKNKLYGGNGLGLSISKAFVEMMGGNIWVESVKGQGSTFYFSIPLQNARSFPQKSGKKLTKDLASLEKIVVMVVEDDETSLQYIDKLLNDKVKDIVYARTFREAKELYRMRTDIGVVLVDIKLPDGDGNELVHYLLSVRPYVRVIVQSAYTAGQFRENALAAGCSAYLTKPIELHLLLQAIEEKSPA